MDVFFDTPHKRHVAERYRNFFMAVSAIATPADYKHIYEGLISGDPKMRAFRALYQRIYGRYINDAKKGEFETAYPVYSHERMDASDCQIFQKKTS